jgi:hypothetical protein
MLSRANKQFHARRVKNTAARGAVGFPQLNYKHGSIITQIVNFVASPRIAIISSSGDDHGATPGPIERGEEEDLGQDPRSLRVCLVARKTYAHGDRSGFQGQLSELPEPLLGS